MKKAPSFITVKGKRYTRWTMRPDKRDAKSEASSLRMKGFSVRIRQYINPGGFKFYVVYRRKK